MGGFEGCVTLTTTATLNTPPPHPHPHPPHPHCSAAAFDFKIPKEDGVDLTDADPWSFIRTRRQFPNLGRHLLPRKLLQKCARRGGGEVVRGVNYRVKHREDLELSPR